MLIEFAEQHQNIFDSVVVRPGIVVRSERPIPVCLPGISRVAITVNELAAAMVDSALSGNGTQTLNNTMLMQQSQ